MKNENNQAIYISPAELSQRWGIPINTIYNRLTRGDDMPRSIRIGGLRRFDLRDVERWETEHAEEGRQ